MFKGVLRLNDVSYIQLTTTFTISEHNLTL